MTDPLSRKEGVVWGRDTSSTTQYTCNTFLGTTLSQNGGYCSEQKEEWDSLLVKPVCNFFVSVACRIRRKREWPAVIIVENGTMNIV